MQVALQSSLDYRAQLMKSFVETLVKDIHFKVQTMDEINGTLRLPRGLAIQKPEEAEEAHG